jgi:hypothetical protein
LYALSQGDTIFAHASISLIAQPLISLRNPWDFSEDDKFKFYKQVTDDPEFAKTVLDWLFERYLSRSEKG